MHKLRLVRTSYGLSVKDLSILSDISEGAIHKIESGKKTERTHEGVAEALAYALDVCVSDLFTVEELTHLGRPPHTGIAITPLRLVESWETICYGCHLVVNRAIGCTECAA